MEKLFLLTLICLQVAIVTASPSGRIYKVARGHHSHHRRELQDDPCTEEVSNDRDISNDERARSNIFRHGSNRHRRHHRHLKVAPKAFPFGKAKIGKASGKAKGQTNAPTKAPTAFNFLSKGQTSAPTYTLAPTPKTGKASGKASGKAKGLSKGKSKAPTAFGTKAPTAFGDFGEGSNDFASNGGGAILPTLSPTGVLRTPVSTCIPTQRPVVPTLPPKPYETDTDTSVSTCVEDPDEDGIFEDELLRFKYNLYVPTGANQTNAMNLAEMLIHYGLAEEFLTCDFEDSNVFDDSDDDSSFDIFAIDSNRNATMSSEDCDTTNDPVPSVATDCVVIHSDVNLTAFYPFSSFPYSLPNPAIKNATGFYLNSSMARGDFVWGDVIQTVFKGFVDDDNSTGVAGIVVGRGAAAGGSDGVVASALTGIAGLCLLLFLLFAVQRHRRRNDGYKGPDESLEDSLTFSHASDPGLESLSDGRVQRVLNDEFDFGEDDPQLRFHEQPDVHHCNSAMCLICGGRATNRPTFLKTQTQPDGESRWQQPSTNTRLPTRSYDSMDTVNI